MPHPLEFERLGCPTSSAYLNINLHLTLPYQTLCLTLPYITLHRTLPYLMCLYLTNTVHVGAFAECQFQLVFQLVLAGCMPTAPILFESFLDTIFSTSPPYYVSGFE